MNLFLANDNSKGNEEKSFFFELTGEDSFPMKIRNALAKPSKHSRSYRFAGIAIT
jgi:hypothetical protein